MNERKREDSRTSVVTVTRSMTNPEYLLGLFVSKKLEELGIGIKLKKASESENGEIKLEITGRSFEISEFEALHSEINRDLSTRIPTRIVQYTNPTF